MQPRMSIIVACDDDYVIASDDKIPWKCKADLKNFKELTTGGIVIMGRRTFDSIGHPLSGRDNYVLSRDYVKHQKRWIGKGVRFFPTVESVVASLPTSKHVWIIGGSQIYKAFEKYVDDIWLTRVNPYTKTNHRLTYFSFTLGSWNLKKVLNFPIDSNDTCSAILQYYERPIIDEEYYKERW